jgi:hypothetical protein
MLVASAERGVSHRRDRWLQRANPIRSLACCGATGHESCRRGSVQSPDLGLKRQA